jgi:hypothetical protein
MPNDAIARLRETSPFFVHSGESHRYGARPLTCVKCALDEALDIAEQLQQRVRELEEQAHTFTATFIDHPEGYEGPCMCNECMEVGQ